MSSKGLFLNKLQEATEILEKKNKQRKDLVRCCDCINQDKILLNQGVTQRDKYCPVPINGQLLLNGMRNDQALKAWRMCDNFKWNGEKREDWS